MCSGVAPRLKQSAATFLGAQRAEECALDVATLEAHFWLQSLPCAVATGPKTVKKMAEESLPIDTENSEARTPTMTIANNDEYATNSVISRERVNSVMHPTLLPHGIDGFLEKTQGRAGISEGNDENEDDDGVDLSAPALDELTPSSHKLDGSYGRKPPAGEKLFGLALPLLQQSIVDNMEARGEAADDATVGDDTTVSKENDFPVIPPRGLTEIFKLPDDPAEDAVWFRVLTPREIKGIDGPYSENELKDMYKMGQLKDSTLVWREGEKDWKQVLFQKELRPRLLQLPLLPPRMGSSDPFADLPDESAEYKADKQQDVARAYNPIISLPKGGEIENLQPLYSIPMNNLCTRCGAFAVGHLAGIGRSEVDMVMLRRIKEYPVDLMSEVIPGFLYIGHAAAAKLNVLLEMNISLVVNCTNNLANPPDRVPYYRGKVVALKDKPKSERPANMQAMVDLLDRAADWLENERLSPEKAALSDPIPTPLKLKRTTDKYGRYIRTAEEIGMKRRAGMDGNKKPPPRVLLWSRKGLDRPCFVAGAYMIKFMGMDVQRVMHILETARPGASISRAYRASLDEFSKKYTLGELMCVDCITNSRLQLEARKRDAAEEQKDALGALDADGSLSTAPSATSTDYSQAQTRRAKALPCYTKYANHMRARPRLEGHDPVVALGDSVQYLTRIMLGRTPDSGWANLLDLHLGSRRLGNDAMRDVFAALEATQCLPSLRVINLKGNDLTDAGIIPILDLITPCPELMALNISCNKIGLEGASRLASYLLTNGTLTSLDCSSNPMGDEGVAAVFQCITMVRAEFEAESGIVAEKSCYNRTLTALDCGFTELGHESAAALINVFRDNESLTSVSLDFNVEFTAKDMKHVFNALRSYNRCLQRLSLANTPISTKSIGYLGRTFENQNMPLMRLDLSFCTLASTHLSYLSKSILLACHLTHLSLNSNDLGDLGGEYLSQGIRGRVDEKTGARWPPLQYVDASFCSIDQDGCRMVIEAICSRPTITSFNLSYNNVGEDVEESGVAACLHATCISEMRLNGCNLRSKGASALLKVITDTAQNTLGHSLRALYIADNQIHDRTAEHLSRLLRVNMVLEVLDLGFNLFTPACAEDMQRAKGVTSGDRKEKKLLDLTVNMVGNDCDPYILDTPGMARSKSTFRFGVKASTEDDLNQGFSHVPENARKLHLLRLDANNHAQNKTEKFTLPINNIMTL